MKTVLSFFCVLTFLLPSSAQSPITVYELGKIPDQTVWHGSGRAFQIAGGPFTMTLPSAPKGPVQLGVDDNARWIFRYIPDVADLRPFEAIITDGAKSDTFMITPQPDLLPERSVFPTDRHTQPAISTYEVTTTDTLTALPEALNYQTNLFYKVRIVGETVELQAGHKNGLYEAYSGRRDVKSLEIFAETVVIRSPIRLKQTAVTIRARDLIFEGEGKLQTTPDEKLQLAGADIATGGLPGSDGLKAGDVILHIANFTNRTTNQIVLDLTGGKGQPGGPGQHGANGSSVTALADVQAVSDVGPFGTPVIASYQAVPPEKITYVNHIAFGPDETRGTSTRPTHGKPAKPSGKPGEGGPGGSLTSSIPLADAFTTIGGLSGPPTPPPTAPTNQYTGGVGGTPRRSVHVLFESFQLPILHIDVTPSRFNTTNGANAAIRQALSVAGPNGNITSESNLFSWFHPLWLRKALNHVQSDYLGNNLSAAQARLEDFAAILSAMRESPEWLALDTTIQLELGQMHDEIEILLQRLHAGLDYFGNPAGWTPMLSFEVTKNIFESEIDRAIETLYLSYWIGNKAQTEQQRLDALTAARDQLRKDIEQAQTDYDEAVQNVPVLDAKAGDLEVRIRTTQNSLAFEEQKLLNDTREPDLIFQLRLGLKIAATICQIVPVAQPALNAIGQGVRIASDFDPDRKWDNITNAPSIAEAYKKSPFTASANTQKEAKGKIDPAKAETNSVNYLTMLQQSSVGLKAGVTDIRTFIEKQNAPTPEMLAELEELKSKSPRYKELIEQVEALVEENRKFVEELVITMQRVATLSDVMTQDLLAIDALNNAIAPAATVLDERASVYLDNMKRRAQDRLLKYHYYMAKAYEYRLLKPYSQPLNLEGLFQKFEDIADLNSHTITPEQFTTLRQVYQSLVADVAESIYDDYISNRPQLSVPIRFNLSEEELATLNAGGIVTLNPYDRGLFPVTHENIRIVDLKIFSITTELEGGGAYGSTAYLDLSIAHSGISHLKQDGKILVFRHYNQQTQNPIVWGGRFDPIDNQIDPIRPSDASDSLLRSLLSGPATSDMLLYSRPSAWADLLLSRSYFESGGRKILLRSVRLELVYDFIRRNDGLGLRTLEVATAGVELTTAGDQAKLKGVKLANALAGPKVVELGMLPLLTVDKPDANDRQHARGSFIRIYPTSVGVVQLTAPETYGEWQFQQWADRFGNPLPGGTSVTVQLNMSGDAAIVAQYVLPKPTAPTLEFPVSANGLIVLRWNGGAGTFLQTTANLTEIWQDVPASEGISEISVSKEPGAGARFFRLVRR